MRRAGLAALRAHLPSPLGDLYIVVENRAGTGRGVRAVIVDAQAVRDGEIPLMDDGKTHTVQVELG